MKIMLLWLNAIVFIGYGLALILIPETVSMLTTASAPQTASGMIELRAASGGICLALGILFAMTTRNPALVQFGLVAVVITMLCMATARTLGFLIDGSPNSLMLLYLIAEALMAALALWALRLKDPTTDP